VTSIDQNTPSSHAGVGRILNLKYRFERRQVLIKPPKHTGSPLIYRITPIIFTGVHFANNLHKPICSVVPVLSRPIAEEEFYDTLTQTRYRFREIRTFTCPDQLSEGVITGNK